MFVAGQVRVRVVGLKCQRAEAEAVSDAQAAHGSLVLLPGHVGSGVRNNVILSL